jgi:hypothetical protein
LVVHGKDLTTETQRAQSFTEGKYFYLGGEPAQIK